MGRGNSRRNRRVILYWQSHQQPPTQINIRFNELMHPLIALSGTKRLLAYQEFQVPMEFPCHKLFLIPSPHLKNYKKAAHT